MPAETTHDFSNSPSVAGRYVSQIFYESLPEDERDEFLFRLRSYYELGQADTSDHLYNDLRPKAREARKWLLVVSGLFVAWAIVTALLTVFVFDVVPKLSIGLGVGMYGALFVQLLDKWTFRRARVRSVERFKAQEKADYERLLAEIAMYEDES